MNITLEIPDYLAPKVTDWQNQLLQALEIGLEELESREQIGFSGMTEVLAFLADCPTPQEIINLRPSESLQNQITHLLEKNRTVGLTPNEDKFWKSYESLEHFVRTLKAKALLKIREHQENKKLINKIECENVKF
jgi:hypothetical protein